ncbi:hypothetical protein [Sphingobacterium suaedae]|uniref:DUF5018 domain-containing protein n=2 Tax=Sphingobacterium suaedae TaxID=1686402 RepID=A0ABW5KE61_9SPHI
MCLWSCKTEYADFPYNNIERYIVHDAKGQSLTASIVEQNIFIYWPPYQVVPKSITPIISISERATIVPASGVEINLSNQTPVAYQVTAQDGSTKTYQVHLIVNQPLIRAVPNLPDNNYVLTSGPLSISTEHILTAEGSTSVYLINEQGEEEKLSLASLGVSAINVYIPDETTEGTYRLKVVSGIRSVVTDQFSIVAPPPPSIETLVYIETPDIVDVKKGEHIDLGYQADIYEKYYQNQVSYFKITDRSRVAHQITPQYHPSDNKIRLTLPSNMGVGRLRTIQVFDKNHMQIGGNISGATLVNVID